MSSINDQPGAAASSSQTSSVVNAEALPEELNALLAVTQQAFQNYRMDDANSLIRAIRCFSKLQQKVTQLQESEGDFSRAFWAFVGNQQSKDVIAAKHWLDAQGAQLSDSITGSIPRITELTRNVAEEGAQFSRLRALTISGEFHKLFNTPFFVSINSDLVSQFNAIYDQHKNGSPELWWGDFCRVSQQLFETAANNTDDNIDLKKNFEALRDRCFYMCNIPAFVDYINEETASYALSFQELLDKDPVEDAVDYFIAMSEGDGYKNLRTPVPKGEKSQLITNYKNQREFQWRSYAELSPPTPSWLGEMKDGIPCDRVEHSYFHISHLPGIVEPANNIYVSETITEAKPGAWKTLWDRNIGCIMNMRENNERMVTVEGQTTTLAYGPQVVGEKKTYGEIDVELVSEADHYFGEAEKSVVTKRVFRLTRGQETKDVVQLHMRCWEDRLTPDAEAMLFSLQEAYQCPRMQGILFHCKSGIGRAGTSRLLYNYYRLVKRVFATSENPQEAIQKLGQLELEKVYLLTLFMRDQVQGAEQMTFIRHMIREMVAVEAGFIPKSRPFPGLPAARIDKDERGNNLSITDEDIARAKRGEPVGRPQESANFKTFQALNAVQGKNRAILNHVTEEQAATLIKGMDPDDAFVFMNKIEKLKFSRSLAEILNHIIGKGVPLLAVQAEWEKQVEAEWSKLSEEDREKYSHVTSDANIDDPRIKKLVQMKMWGFRKLMLSGQKELILPLIVEEAAAAASSSSSQQQQQQ